MENNNYNNEPKKKKGISKGGLIAIIIVAVIIVAGIIFGIIYIDQIRNNPRVFFKAISEKTVKTETKVEDTAEEVPELSDFEKLQLEADTSIMQNIVNVLLIGVDYADERRADNPEWKGKTSYHADVMMILAINFDENTADLISVPRDTMIKAMPGVKGIYKMNASLDCGGGFPEGFGEVMAANSWMLGGIPIDYYYAVTMNGCKDLVDVIGGVDYDLEMDFSLAGRSYTAGQQHMDGQAVLDYLRVRKNSGKSKLTGKTGDLNRINRQKDMLVAIFNKLKSQNMLAKLPDILEAFDGQLYTNVSFSQTAALALFGMNLESENIKMHSMTGNMESVYNWSFCLTDQNKRVELIKEVYGIDVGIYEDHTRERIMKDWNEICMSFYGDKGAAVLANANAVGIPPITDGNGNQVADTEGQELLNVCNDLQNQYNALVSVYNGGGNTYPPIDFPGYVANNDYVWIHKFLMNYRDNMKALAKKVGDKVGKSDETWNYEYEETQNEVVVDFR